MKDLEHKGFISSVEYDEESQTLYGQVKCINGLISYESEDGTMSGLLTAFKESVDEYLEDCKQMKLNPQQPAKVARYDVAGMKASLEDFTAVMKTLEQPPRANQALTEAMHQHPEQGSKLELQNIPRK